MTSEPATTSTRVAQGRVSQRSVELPSEFRLHFEGGGSPHSAGTPSSTPDFNPSKPDRYPGSHERTSAATPLGVWRWGLNIPGRQDLTDAGVIKRDSSRKTNPEGDIGAV